MNDSKPDSDFSLNIGLIHPNALDFRNGNQVTADRWSRIFKKLGHRVTVSTTYNHQDFDCLVALHAYRSAESIEKYRKQYIRRPLIVVLTGTDIYRDIHENPETVRSLELATHLVVLQPKALQQFSSKFHNKTRVIYQAAHKSQFEGSKIHKSDAFDIAVIGHLRDVKDPFLAAQAARLLPSSSKVRILHVGRALTRQMRKLAEKEMDENPRYQWLKEKSQSETAKILCSSRLLVHSSLLEGGANAVSEAVVNEIPILASRIPGNVGMLNEEYGGYFSPQDSEELAKLMLRAEAKPAFLTDLRGQLKALADRFDPKAERKAWRILLESLRT